MKKLIDTYVEHYGFFASIETRPFGTTGDNWYKKFDCLKDIKDTLTSSSLGEYSSISFLDNEYYFNHSGEKPITPLLNNLLYQGKMQRIQDWDTIFLLCYSKYKNKWDRLYALLSEEYNPIQNYSMTEKEDIPTQTKKTNTDISDHFEEQEDAKQENDVYGFNSTTPVPSSESKSTKDKLTNFNDRHITGLATNNYEETSYNKKRELTREGNIGVTTSQQMIESEIALWQWNFIQEVIYKDIDELLTQNFYESEI